MIAQLLHVGLRSHPVFEDRSGPRSLRMPPYMLAPSQVPIGEIPGGPTPKALEEHEIEQVLQSFAEAAGARSPPASMASNFTLPTAICPGSSCRRSTISATIGGADPTRTGCDFRSNACDGFARDSAIAPSSAIASTRRCSGKRSEIEDVKRVHLDLEQQTDIDYVSVSAGVHHSWIHTPMTFEQGWEREYSRASNRFRKSRSLSSAGSVLLTWPKTLSSPAMPTPVLLSRQMIADGQWMTKVKEGREKDIRRCVAANYCWRSVIRGSRVQCAYNPVVGRELVWGVNSLTSAYSRKRVLVVGAGPAGLEYARVASAAGHAVSSTSVKLPSADMFAPMALCRIASNTETSRPGLRTKPPAMAHRSS